MNKKDIILGLIIAIILAILSFLASSSPDGLERVAEDRDFIERATSVIKSPIPDYLFPGMSNDKFAGSIAGLVGVIVVFSLGLGLAYLLRKNK